MESFPIIFVIISTFCLKLCSWVGGGDFMQFNSVSMFKSFMFCGVKKPFSQRSHLFSDESPQALWISYGSLWFTGEPFAWGSLHIIWFLYICLYIEPLRWAFISSLYILLFLIYSRSFVTDILHHFPPLPLTTCAWVSGSNLWVENIVKRQKKTLKSKEKQVIIKGLKDTEGYQSGLVKAVSYNTGQLVHGSDRKSPISLEL